MKILYMFPLLFGLVACGSDSSSSSAAPEFAQNVNVNEIHYALTEIRISGELTFEDGSIHTFDHLIEHPEAISSEQVVRRTVDNQYTLQVNEQKAQINIGSSGQFDSNRVTDQKDGCSLEGRARAKGEAVYDRLDLDYELEIDLSGDDCPRSVEEAYARFAEKELDGLPFIALQKLRETGSLQVETSKTSLVRIRALGVVASK